MLLARAMPASRSGLREALRAMLEGRGGGEGRWGEGGGGVKGSEEVGGEVEKGRWRHLILVTFGVSLARHWVFIVTVVQG